MICIRAVKRWWRFWYSDRSKLPVSPLQLFLFCETLKLQTRSVQQCYFTVCCTCKSLQSADLILGLQVYRWVCHVLGFYEHKSKLQMLKVWTLMEFFVSRIYQDRCVSFTFCVISWYCIFIIIILEAQCFVCIIQKVWALLCEAC